MGNITKYNWDFGDGYFSTFKNPSHTYADTGRYLVCLKVENSNNVSDSRCKFIKIGNTLDNKCEYSCVWPGDANNSTEANHYDLLSICVSYGEKGPARDSISTRWIGHYAENWTSKQFNGQNNKHVDCNGDGVVDTADIRAIIKNFASSHVYQPGKTRKYNAANPDLYFELSETDVAPGTSVDVSIMTGRDTISLYGVGFEVKVDMNKVKNKEVVTDFSNSWLGTKGSNMLTFTNIDQTLGDVSVSTSRFDKNNQIGYGEVGKISFTVDSSVSEGDEIVICLSSDYGMDANGDTITFNNGYCDTLKVVGISSIENDLNISIYPNPSKGTVYIDFPANLSGTVDLELLNTLGQEMLSKTITVNTQTELDIKKFEPGVYFLHITQGDKQFKQRLLLVR
jgi:PKD repeat protein